MINNKTSTYHMMLKSYSSCASIFWKPCQYTYKMRLSLKSIRISPPIPLSSIYPKQSNNRQRLEANRMLNPDPKPNHLQKTWTWTEPSRLNHQATVSRFRFVQTEPITSIYHRMFKTHIYYMVDGGYL